MRRNLWVDSNVHLVSLSISAFGRRCRELRAARGYVIAHQAQILDSSLSFISEVEFGQAHVPNSWPAKIASWLELEEEEQKELLDLSYVGKTVEITSTGPNTSAVIRQLSERFSDLSAEERYQIEQIIWRK